MSVYLNLLNEDICFKVYMKNIGFLKRYDGIFCVCWWGESVVDEFIFFNDRGKVG